VPVALALALAQRLGLVRDQALARPQVPGPVPAHRRDPVRAQVQDRMLGPAPALVRGQELGLVLVPARVQVMGKGKVQVQVKATAKDLDTAKGTGRARARVPDLARDTVREVAPVEDLAMAKVPALAPAKDQDPATVKVTALARAPVMAKALDTVRVQEEDTEKVQAQAQDTARDTATDTALVLEMANKDGEQRLAHRCVFANAQFSELWCLLSVYRIQK